MLWYKGWLETRFRVLFVFGFLVLFIGLIARTIPPHPPHFHPETLLNPLTLFVAIMSVLLGGAGIRTQPLLRRNRGLYGSMYFTLSLPVSRLRLLATRAGLGMLETWAVLVAMPCAAWIMVPALRPFVTGLDLFAYWVTASVCASAFYFLSVLLGSFLEEEWQIYGSLAAISVLWWLSTTVSVPSSVNIFRAMVKSSPLFTHTFPWACMGVSLGASAILFLAALRVVQTREY